MSIYKIQGNIDFYSELYKSLDEEENNFKTSEDDKLCLITKQLLIENYVEMECGHKFNYLPLFKDIETHKKNFNNMEGPNSMLGKNEIRCPYCRKKQSTLLPYYENMGVRKVVGVNEIYIPTIHNNISHTGNYGFCKYISVVPINVTDISVNLISANVIEPTNVIHALDLSGNNIKKCNCYGTSININGANYGDDNPYCWKHKKIMIQKYKQILLNKKKEEVKLVKLKAKQDKKEAKIQEKEAQKLLKIQEKKLLKEQKKKLLKEEKQNVVLSQLTLIDLEKAATGCIAILKTGKNNGHVCGCTVFNSESQLCKRHCPKTQQTPNSS